MFLGILVKRCQNSVIFVKKTQPSQVDLHSCRLLYAGFAVLSHCSKEFAGKQDRREGGSRGN